MAARSIFLPHRRGNQPGWCEESICKLVRLLLRHCRIPAHIHSDIGRTLVSQREVSQLPLQFLHDLPVRRHGARALRRLIRMLEVSNQVRTVRRIGHAVVGHRGAGHHGQGLGQEPVERLVVPDDLGPLHRFRIAEPGHAAGQPAEQAAVPGADAVDGQRVTGQASRIDLLAAYRVGQGRWLWRQTFRLACARSRPLASN